jgi:hypothetical protein
MDISRYGKFSFTIKAEELSRGLRPSKRVPRNSGFLTTCSGAVGRDGVLQVLDELEAINTSGVTFTFPYPQMFVFTNIIIVCSATDIYEYSGGVLVHKLNVSSGSTWSAVDFYDFIYMSNGFVAVLRDPVTMTFSVTTDLPDAEAICNFNGQVLIGSPKV